MPGTIRTVGLLSCLLLDLVSSRALANTPPTPPVIIEPSELGRLIDPGDVHMATAPFRDDDSGDALLCTDWEIRSATGKLIWYAGCAGGVLAVHIHIGDGAFINAEGHLLGSMHYQVRIRFRDSSGDPDTEWSDWSIRDFNTGPGSAVRAMVIDDVLSSPPPRLRDAAGAAATLPPDASLALTSERGELLLSFSGSAATNPPTLRTHALVKCVVRSGAEAHSLPPLTIDFADETGAQHAIVLPALALSAGATIEFWIAQDGSSFDAFPGDAAPNFAKVARGAGTPWKVFDPGYIVERVVSGLQLPVNIAFVPNPMAEADAPLFYVTELYGTIRAVLRNGAMRDYATGLLNFNPTGIFPGSGEHGSVGTAVDPDSGDLFVATVYASGTGDHDPKVIRLRSSDGGRTASSVKTVLDMAGEDIGPSHQISSVSIGPDGRLYVHVGDGFHTELATDLHSFRGKILRLNVDGSAPPDNPFYDSSDGITAADYVFAYGFRNPFGGAWRAADASLYEVENGPVVDRLAKVGAGMNYRWNGSDDDMRANAAYNWEQSVAPVNIAFIQDATFAGSGFAAAKRDRAFVTESGPTWVSGTSSIGKRIREFAFDPSGHVLSTRPFAEYIGSGYASVAALAAGPDGLYFSDLFPDRDSPIAHGANVYRIRHVGTAAIAAAVTDDVQRTVAFSAILTVPEYSGLTWNFGDGTTSGELDPEHTFAANGAYDVRLSVVGAQNTVIEDYKRVEFLNRSGSGLLAFYTNAQGDRFSRIDPQVNFDWQLDAPPMTAESFNITWSGEIAASVSGIYAFILRSDGTGVLRIDGQTVIDTRSRDASSNPMRLEAGRRYTFVLECADTPMRSVTQLSWSSDGLPARVIPATAFYPLAPHRRAVRH
ncbi:MAG: PQQ-dependent sugar dehydrogenase [Acidobacteriota bacterium]